MRNHEICKNVNHATLYQFFFDPAIIVKWEEKLILNFSKSDNFKKVYWYNSLISY